MERLTLEEAIIHAKEVTKTNRAEATYNFPNLKEYYDNCLECANQHNQLAEWLEELKSYKEAEEHGLLVRLPCKVGDKVWDNDFGHPESYEIKAFSYGYRDSYVEPDIEDQIIFYYENYSGSITGAFPMSEIGKTVFITREEVEKKLEEMKRMAEYVKKSDVIKIMEDNSCIMEVFGVKKKMIDGFAMCCDFADLKIVEIDDEEDD